MLAMNKSYFSIVAIACMVALASCSDKRSTGLEYARNMYDPIAYNPDQANKNFKNGQTAQTPPSHTMPVGFSKTEDQYPNTLEGYESAGKNLSNPLSLQKAISFLDQN